jgi:2-haloacid dehalogenase
MSVPAVDAVVFDLGGVVVDWSPRHLYRQVIADDVTLARFLTEICTLEWHAQHDRGRPMAETIPAMCARYPEFADEIGVWRERYVDMIDGYVEGMEQLLDDLRASGLRLFALSNMPAEVVGDLVDAFPLIGEFDGRVISGEELVVKPDPELYRRLMARFDLVAERTVFVDDMVVNVEAAAALGFRAIRFESATHLRAELRDAGVLDSSMR